MQAASLTEEGEFDLHTEPMDTKVRVIRLDVFVHAVRLLYVHILAIISLAQVFPIPQGCVIAKTDPSSIMLCIDIRTWTHIQAHVHMQSQI